MEDGVISSTEEINNRQKNLIGDYSNTTVLIVGLGGIGSWCGINLSLLGVGNLILFDDDRIENSNLNRTLFKLSQVGQYKCTAVKELISERRKDTIVLTNNELFTIEHLKKYQNVDHIFDCTDKLILRNAIAQFVNDTSGNIPQYVKLGYDGYEGTVSINNFDSGLWGEDPSSYSITPSFFGTPSILASIAIIEMILKRKKQSKTVHFNVKKILTTMEEYNKVKM
ncbi:MAG: ThiF family adenylyltransferase [Ignavibacteriae bacterium]|nr:ThiF family adenylyltransferase [Ignavibacteriota bacterium]